MKKNLLPFLVASLLIGGLIGCTSKNQEIDHAKTATLLAQEGHLVYSNLLDEASREEVLNRLSAAGVLPKNVETADILIQDYNERMSDLEEGDFVYQEGFVDTVESRIAYGNVDDYMKKWQESSEADDIYCRIFAFLLLHNRINIEHCLSDDHWDEKIDFLYYDKQAIEKNGLLTFTKEQQASFLTLFETAEIIGDGSIENISDSVAKQWKQFGVTFQKSKLSLITLWQDQFDLPRIVMLQSC